MDLSKEYLYNREKIILLVCDFYETSQIPKNMLDIKDNLALFPVANIPLVEYILTSLMDQNLKNVIIAGSKIESVVEHVKSTRFMKLMNISVLKTNGKSMGDIFREIYGFGHELLDIVVMYANHYTNISIKELMKRHRMAKDTILTVFSHKVDTNDIHTHIYGTQGNEIKYYEKVQGNKVNSEDLLHVLNKEKTLYVSTWYGSPTIAVVSGQVLSIFSDNFDYETLGDFMTGMLATELYNCKFQLVSYDDLKLQASEPGDFSSSEDSEPIFYLDDDGNEETPYHNYSREIITLSDYFMINNDVLKLSSSVFRLPQTPDYVKGDVKKMHKIENSVVGEKSFVNAGLKNCVVWENCHVSSDLNDSIIVTNNSVFKIFHLELNVDVEEDKTPVEHQDKKETFFDDFTDYLTSIVEVPGEIVIDYEEVFKEISLIRIVWNASHHEVIEAFAFFFVEITDAQDLEGSISKATEFFGILAEFVQTMDDQELLMECLHWNLSDVTDYGLKTNIFFNFALLLVEHSIIEKSVVKQFNKMHKAGEF